MTKSVSIVYQAIDTLFLSNIFKKSFMLTLIHRQSCSKSRCLYQYLTDQQIPFVVRDYMVEPLSRPELKSLLEQLKLPASAIIRKTDPAFKLFHTTINLNDQERVIELISQYPALLQRPILTDGRCAVIGRPFEHAVDFLLRKGYDR